MNLVLDLGNSYGKIAVCDQKKVIEAATYEKISSREIAYFNTRSRWGRRVVYLFSDLNLIASPGEIFPP